MTGQLYLANFTVISMFKPLVYAQYVCYILYMITLSVCVFFVSHVFFELIFLVGSEFEVPMPNPFSAVAGPEES